MQKCTVLEAKGVVYGLSVGGVKIKSRTSVAASGDKEATR